MSPWRDYSGHVSASRLVVFLALFVPAIWIGFQLETAQLGPEPFKEAMRQIGLWTIRLLFISLAISPLHRTFRWAQLVSVRRMIGVATFAYALAHLTLYAADQGFDLRFVVSEIVHRIYLTIGFAALLVSAVLAATSTDGMVRRLGGRGWTRLHRLVYLVALLAAVHFSIQSKADEWEPTIMAGLLTWLMGCRAITWVRKDRRLPMWSLFFVSLFASIATALGEAFYFWLKLGVDPLRVLGADFTTVTGIRPAVIVFLMTGTISVGSAFRHWVTRAWRSKRLS
jgi:sulfoxide reductase heme-binding subunit YedZ